MLWTVDLVFRRSIDFFVIGSMIMNTIIITTHLNKVIQKHTRLSAVNSRLVKVAMDEENVSQEIVRERKEKVNKSAHHARFKKGELLQVKLQGAFFIGSYVICNFATIILQLIVSQKSKLGYEEEMEVPYNYYPLMVLQAILFPLLGFLNCIAYMKPSFARTRSQHRQESTFWVLRRTILGVSSVPTTTVEEQQSKAATKTPKRISKSKTRRSKSRSRGQPMKVSFKMDEVEEEEVNLESGTTAEDVEKLEGSGTDETSGSDLDATEVEEREETR